MKAIRPTLLAAALTLCGLAQAEPTLMLHQPTLSKDRLAFVYGGDIWITDRTRRFWVLQVMVFDDEGDRVIYRRDRRITWAKQHHSLEIGGIRVLNPMITFLFKTNKPHLEDKEVQDVMQLIRHLA